VRHFCYRIGPEGRRCSLGAANGVTEIFARADPIAPLALELQCFGGPSMRPRREALLLATEHTACHTPSRWRRALRFCCGQLEATIPTRGRRHGRMEEPWRKKLWTPSEAAHSSSTARGIGARVWMRLGQAFLKQDDDGGDDIPKARRGAGAAGEDVGDVRAGAWPSCAGDGGGIYRTGITR